MDNDTCTAKTNHNCVYPDCRHGLDPPELITIDPDGDLHLVVGENECLPQSQYSTEEPNVFKRATTFVVCSRTLSRSSPVWKRLLYGGFAEAQRPDGENQWTVHLPEDDQKCMEIALNCAHGRFRQVPDDSDLGFEDLYELTVLSDKYDLAHIFWPWAARWLEVTRNRLGQEISYSYHKYSIDAGPWVAWELGDRRLFETQLESITDSSMLNEEGLLIYDFGESPDVSQIPVLESALEPPGMLDMIRARRLDLIDRALSKLRAVTRQPNSDEGILCFEKDEREYSCKSLSLGSLVNALDKGGLWPLPETSACRLSPKWLGRKLERAHSSWQDTLPLNKRHKRCIHGAQKWVGLSKAANSIGNYPIDISDNQKRRLDAQAEKTGADRAPYANYWN